MKVVEKNMFSKEENLVFEFIKQLDGPSSPWGKVRFQTEFNYQRGKTDLILFKEGSIIAIEAKLYKWREALQQAYRNKCFADYSYILIPETELKKALKYHQEFSRRNVGICSLTNNQISIVYTSLKTLPLQPWLKERAIKFIQEEDNICH